MASDNDSYAGIIDNLHHGLYFVDRDSIIYWNNAEEKISA